MEPRERVADRPETLLRMAARARSRALELVGSASALQGQARQLAFHGRRLRELRLRLLGDRLTAALDDALSDQRARLRSAVDDDVLQYACAAQQDLLEIQEADPSGSLTAAIGNLTEAIDALRRLVDHEADIDAALVAQAETYVHRALGQREG